MIRMYARRTFGISVTAGGDLVMFGIGLPSGTVVHSTRLSMELVTGNALLRDEAAGYAVEGWVLPVLDPDAVVSLDTVWDTLVPKDTDVQTLDMDTTAVDATNFWEPGEADFSALLNLGLRPDRIFERSRIISFGSPGSPLFIDSTDLVSYFAKDSFLSKIKKGFRVEQPSVMVFACASPAMDDVVTAIGNVPKENEWGRIKYIGQVVGQMMIDLLGLTEAGAESPWEEATSLIQEYLEPNVYETGGPTHEAKGWTVFGQAMIDLSVVGEIEKITLSTGR